MTIFSFRPEQRLLQAAEFQKVFDGAQYKIHQSGFMLLATHHPTSARLGFVVAKRKVRRAHERNRIKRLARESFRLNQAQLPALDIILMAKSEALNLSNAELYDQLRKAWRALVKKAQSPDLANLRGTPVP
jgi:ribonuclease P protein component